MKTLSIIGRFVLLLLLSNISNDSRAQFLQIDSLIQITKQPSCDGSNMKICLADTARIDCYILLCRQYQDRGSYQTAMDYGENALKLSRKIKSREREVNAHNRIAEIFRLQGNYGKALENHFVALRISDEVNYLNGQARAAKNIGVLYYHLGEYDKALESYGHSLELYKSFEAGKLGVGHCLHNIGTISSLQKKFPEALEYFKEALVIKEYIQDEVGIAAARIKIGIIYMELAVAPDIEGANSDVEEHLNNSLRYLTLGLDLSIEMSYQKGESDAYNNLGELYFVKNEYATSISYLLSGLEVASRIGTKQYIRNAHQGMAKVFKKTGRFEQALFHYENYIAYRDSLVNEENSRAVIYQQTKYEFEKKELIEEQKERETARIMAERTSRRDNLQYSAISIFLVLLVVALVIASRRKQSPLEGSGPEGRSLPAGRQGVLRLLEGLIFFTFLIFFEFLLVLADPYIEDWSGGAPGIKLLFNAGIAGLIFPLHSFFETNLKSKIVTN